MAAYFWDIVTDSLQTGPSSPSFITSGRQQTLTKPTQLENRIKDIVISAYSSNNKDPLSPTRVKDPSTTMSGSPQQPVIYSADDTANSPTSPIFPLKPVAAGPALSTAQGEPNLPIALRSSEPSSSNLSDLDKSIQLMYSPQDPSPLTNHPSPPYTAPLLTNAFSIPPPVLRGGEEEEGSVYSEPIGRRSQSVSPTTPTPSLPGNITLRMPAHLRTSRPLNIPSSHCSPSLSSASTPTGEESHDWSHDLRHTSHDYSVPSSNPINTQQIKDMSQGLGGVSRGVGVSQSLGGVSRGVGASQSVGGVSRGLGRVSQSLGGVPQEGVSHLRDQLRQLMEEKAHLEGQLESVIEECQTTLTERAQLQSKLAQTEVELTSLKGSDVKKQKSVVSDNKIKKEGEEEEEGIDLQNEIDRLESTLSSKRRELVEKNREIEREKQKVKQLSDQLNSALKLSEERQKQVQEGQLNVSNLETTLDERDDTIEELKGQMSSLKATLNSTETSKAWLHEQLQNAIDSKSKLHEEMRSLRATNTSQSIKMDNLSKENSLYQKQIHDLQKSILQDKAKLVTELEAIEEDVLHKEGNYLQVQAEKEQLEQQLALKSSQLDQLTSTLADQKASSEELSNRLDDAAVSMDSLRTQLKELADERNQLSDSVRQYQQSLSLKEQENKELKRTKNSLHQRLQQAETCLVTKDGTLQGMEDSTSILKHELDTLRNSKDGLEEDLNKYQATNLKLESLLEASDDKCERLESELKGFRKRETQNEGIVASLQDELSRKQNELTEKDEIVNELQTQSEELRNHFRSLQDQFESIANESGVGLEEKEKMISQLETDKRELEQQLTTLLEHDKELKGQIETLKGEKARLEGELETALNTGPHLDDFRRALKEKNDLDSQLVSERLGHKQELIKTQAKVARLDTELKDIRKESKKKESSLRKELESAGQTIDDLKGQLEEMKNNTITQPARDEVDGLHETMKEKDTSIERLEQEKLDLQEETRQLRTQLREEGQRLNQKEQELDETRHNFEEEIERNREQYESERHQLIVEGEHLKGRLAGINRSQACMREHTSSLEKALASKETQLQQVSQETESLLANKAAELSELESKLSQVKDNESGLKMELEKALNDALLERQRANERERQLETVREELEQLKEDMSEVKHAQELEEQIDMLEQVKIDLQSEVRALKQQLAVSQGNTDTVQRELQEKTDLIMLLEQNLNLSKDRLDQTQNELEQLQAHLNEKQSSPYRPHPSSSTPHFVDGGLSPVVVKTDSLLDELQRAREEGGEEVEKEKSKEISTLRTQLGSKSMTLKNLQSCLRDLKNDMGYIQSKMDHHSHSLQNSYKSSQKLEDRIKLLQLSRSNSGGSTGGSGGGGGNATSSSRSMTPLGTSDS